MLNNRPERKRREISKRTHNDNGSDEQDDEQRTVCRQGAAGHRNQFLSGQTARDCKRRNDEKEPGDQHVDAEGQVVPRRIGSDSGKGAAVVAGSAGICVEDLGEAVWSPIVEVSGRRTERAIPVTILGEVRNRTDGGESQDAHRSRKNRDYRHLTFFLLDLLSTVFRRTADHQAANENSNDDVYEHAVEPGPYTAENHFVGLNVEQRNQTAKRREAVVHADNGTATRVGGYGRKERSHRVAEPDFFAFHVPAGLTGVVRALDPHSGGHR